MEVGCRGLIFGQHPILFCRRVEVVRGQCLCVGAKNKCCCHAVVVDRITLDTRRSPNNVFYLGSSHPKSVTAKIPYGSAWFDLNQDKPTTISEISAETKQGKEYTFLPTTHFAFMNPVVSIRFPLAAINCLSDSLMSAYSTMCRRRIHSLHPVSSRPIAIYHKDTSSDRLHCRYCSIWYLTDHLFHTVVCHRWSRWVRVGDTISCSPLMVASSVLPGVCYPGRIFGVVRRWFPCDG